MDEIQISNALINHHNYHGVMARDQIQNINKLGSYILNLDLSKNSGNHWVSISITKDKLFYFDSYGVSPPSFITDFAKSRNITHIFFNNIFLQKYTQRNCGNWSIQFCKANITTLIKFRKFIKNFIKL